MQKTWKVIFSFIQQIAQRDLLLQPLQIEFAHIFAEPGGVIPNIFVVGDYLARTLLERKRSVAGIPRYCTDWLMILHEVVHVFPIFVLYHELIRLVTRNPCHTLLSFLTVLFLVRYSVHSVHCTPCLFSKEVLPVHIKPTFLEKQ